MCISEEEEDDEGEKMRWFCKWRRERKKEAKLEIIKILVCKGTVTVHICTVTVVLLHLCAILHQLIFFFLLKCAKWTTFYILQDFTTTNVVALS